MKVAPWQALAALVVIASALVRVTDRAPLPATVQPAPALVCVVKERADRPHAECAPSTAKPLVPCPVSRAREPIRTLESSGC